MLQKQPEDRMSANDAASHPWIKKESRLHKGTDAAHELEEHGEIVRSLEAFSAADGIAKLALQVIAFSTPPSKLEELRTVFQKMDTDSSGSLSLDEFKRAMAMHPEIPQKRIEEMFGEMDIKSTGEVDYTQFLAATLSSSKLFNASSKSILAAFNVLDSDQDGFISAADLEAAFGSKITPASTTRILCNADESGKVNFESFKRSILHMLAGGKEAEAEAQNAQTMIAAMTETCPSHTSFRKASSRGLQH